MQTHVIPPALAPILQACAKTGAPADTGLAAYDFSPVHLASLLMDQNLKIAPIQVAIAEWRKTHGTASSKTDSVAFPEINAVLMPPQVDALCAEIEENLLWADHLAQVDKLQRFPRRFGKWDHLDPEIPRPLGNLITACEKICVAGCCGLSAYDFSPIHIASHLIQWRGDVSEHDVQEIRAAIASWRQCCGTASGKSEIFSSKEMNAVFTPQEVDGLCRELEQNLTVAVNVARSVELYTLHHVPDEWTGEKGGP